MPTVTMQRARLLRNSYASGHTNVVAGKSFGCDSSVVQCTFIPLPGDDYQDQFSQLGVVLTFQDVDGTSTSAAPLRPLFRTQSRIEVYTTRSQAMIIQTFNKIKCLGP
ncbi:hypothetical protein DPMN_042480 [Dreissena polymorpha]|uniref:Uncharacterized protein n=1 Tax=Dreissena polymorpha TaxID=45954 RepID=A0A9D4D147_DREPO|nr:hypothetical protein DPMN_042480 [Dreissena polymorpha]